MITDYNESTSPRFWSISAANLFTILSSLHIPVSISSRPSLNPNIIQHNPAENQETQHTTTQKSINN